VTWTAIRRAAPAMALTTLVLLPFLGKAFTIDDTLFLCQAEHVLVDPLHPTAFEMIWSEAPVPLRVSSIMPSGRIMAYLLLPSVCLDGAEWAAHLVQLILLLAGITATVLLGLRLGLTPRQAGIAAWLLSATPVALAMAGTAMPDIPAMALGVIGLERLLAWKMEQRWHQGVLAAVALALAALSRSHLALLLGLGAFLLVGGFPDRRSPALHRWRALAPLGLAALITAVALAVTRDPQPQAGGIASSALLFSALANFPPNFVSFLVHWVLVIPLGLPWLLIRRRDVLRSPVLYLAAVGSAAVVLPRSGGAAAFC
jgi:hypothetical protein